MRNPETPIRFSISAAFAIAMGSICGCAGNPLLGSWRYDNTAELMMVPIIGPHVASSTADITFAGDGTATGVVSISIAATAPLYAGCTQTTNVSNIAWTSSQDGGTNGITIGGSPSGVTARTGCTDARSNTANVPETNGAILNAFSGSGFYTINGTTMTYTRQQPSAANLTLMRR